MTSRKSTKRGSDAAKGRSRQPVGEKVPQPLVAPAEIAAAVRAPVSVARTRLFSRGAVFFACVAFITFAYFRGAASWNQNSRFNLTRAVVEEGTLNIDSYYWNTGDRARRDGHYYTEKAPGTALAAVPMYAAYYWGRTALGLHLPAQRLQPGTDPNLRQEGDYHPPVEVNQPFMQGMYLSTLFAVALCTALGLLWFWSIARQLAVDRAAATLAVLACGFGCMLFPYSTSFYSHAPAAIFLFVTCAMLWPLGSAPRYALAGLSLSCAVLAEYLVVFPAAALVVVVALRDRKGLLQFCLGGLPAAVLLAVYHTICFGKPWATGYSFVDNPIFAAGHSTGFLGLGFPQPDVMVKMLFGLAGGFFVWSPVGAFAALGLGLMAWQARTDARLRAWAWTSLSVVAFFIVAVSSYYMWWGGAAPAPRQAIPLLPFLSLGLVRLRAGWLRKFAWGALVVSIGCMVVTSIVGVEVFARQTLFEFYGGALSRDDVPYWPSMSNAGLFLGLTGKASVLPLFALWGVAGWFWWRHVAGKEDEPVGRFFPRRTNV